MSAGTPPGRRRVVSLVPSLTEAVAVTLPGSLVGATDWCTHPAGLAVTRVGGTKNPDVAAIRALAPDVVLVNQEENRLSDVEALRAAGLRVYETFPRTVDGALDELGAMLAALGAPGEPDWLTAARAAWAGLAPVVRARRAVIPVWRRPWVVVGSATFAGDVLRRLGILNLYGDDEQRWPRPRRPEILDRGPDLVVLPDEPYRFSATDGPEAFPGIPWVLVSGRHLTWYGPSLAEAPARLGQSLGDLTEAG
jgi:ABC-type Fe3+-hydroxamate transport system substrate-binding protein